MCCLLACPRLATPGPGAPAARALVALLAVSTTAIGSHGEALEGGWGSTSSAAGCSPSGLSGGELDPFVSHLGAVAAALQWLLQAAPAGGPLPPSFGDMQRTVSCAITAGLNAMHGTAGSGRLPFPAPAWVELALVCLHHSKHEGRAEN